MLLWSLVAYHMFILRKLTSTMGSLVSKFLRLGGSSSTTALAEDRLLLAIEIFRLCNLMPFVPRIICVFLHDV